MYMKGLVAKLNTKLGLCEESTKSQMSMPFVFVMKITPGRVGEKAPQVLWAPWVTYDLKIGFS